MEGKKKREKPPGMIRGYQVSFLKLGNARFTEVSDKDSNFFVKREKCGRKEEGSRVTGRDFGLS